MIHVDMVLNVNVTDLVKQHILAKLGSGKQVGATGDVDSAENHIF